MKLLAVILALVFTVTPALACQSGDWREVSTQKSTKTISTTLYGRVKTGVYLLDEMAMLTYGNVGEEGHIYEFNSDPFDLVDLDLLTGFKALVNLPENLLLEVFERIDKSQRDDECFNVPANSLRISTYYSFDLKIPNVGVLSFGTTEDKFAPPAKN